MGNLCAIKTNFQIGPDNFEARFEGNGKTLGYIVIASVQEYSYEQTARIYMLTRAGRWSDNYVTLLKYIIIPS